MAHLLDRTLRLQGLLKADEMAVRVHLAQQGVHAAVQGGITTRWRLTDDNDADLLIRASGAAAPFLPPPRPIPVVWLLEPGEAPPRSAWPVLNSPLEREAFLTVMEVVARRLHDDDWLEEQEGAEGDAGPGAPPVFAKTQLLSPSEMQRLADKMPRKPAPARFDTHGILRLRQWPSHEFLAEQRYAPRLASFLLNRWHSVDELEALSKVERADVIDFLNGAIDLGLLEIRMPEGNRASVPAPEPAVAKAPPARVIERRQRPIRPVLDTQPPEPVHLARPAAPAGRAGRPVRSGRVRPGLWDKLLGWWRTRD